MVTQTRKRRPGGAGEATAALPKVSERAEESGYEYNDGLLAPPRVWLTLPLPPYKLTPNGTRNRMERHRLATDARTVANLTARELLLNARAPFFPGPTPVVLDVLVTLKKGQRQLDQDNLHGLLKSTVDGLQGWVIQRDSQISLGTVTWERGAVPVSLVRLTITRRDS